MRAAVALALCLIASIPARAESSWDPSKSGKVECFDPDFEKKTCSAMTTYTWLDDTNVIAHSSYYDRNALPNVLMTGDWEATIRGDKNCTVVSKESFAKTEFQVDGKRVSEEQAATYLARIEGAYRPLYGRTLCADISPVGKAYVVQISADGVPNPTATSYLAWIDPDAGYKLVP